MGAASEPNSRAAVFNAARFASMPELEKLRSEIRRRSRGRSVNYIHCDILWRVRQGETVTAERMADLYPFVTATNAQAMHAHIQHLRDWGFLSAATPTLALTDTD